MNKRPFFFIILLFVYGHKGNAQIEENENFDPEIQDQVSPEETYEEVIPSIPEEIYFEDERELHLDDETTESIEESSSQ
jgi:hypothetical protein